MIDRYSRKELKAIWSEENKYKIWLDIEVAAAEAMEKYKIIPKGVSFLVKKKPLSSLSSITVFSTTFTSGLLSFLAVINKY